MKKQAKKALRELEAAISKLPIAPSCFAYIDLMHTVQQLFCQRDYGLVVTLCKSAIKSIKAR